MMLFPGAFQRRKNMTRKALLILAVSSLCGILTAPLSAQTAQPMSRFDIPFQFTVNGRTMPAGEYTVAVRTFDGLVEIDSKGAHHRGAFSVTYPAGNAVSDQAVLTFHRYGNKYFLARISQPGGYAIRGLAVSPAESETAKAPSSVPLQTVTLAALSAGR